MWFYAQTKENRKKWLEKKKKKFGLSERTWFLLKILALCASVWMCLSKWITVHESGPLQTNNRSPCHSVGTLFALAQNGSSPQRHSHIKREIQNSITNHTFEKGVIAVHRIHFPWLIQADSCLLLFGCKALKRVEQVALVVTSCLFLPDFSCFPHF